MAAVPVSNRGLPRKPIYIWPPPDFPSLASDQGVEYYWTSTGPSASCCDTLPSGQNPGSGWEWTPDANISRLLQTIVFRYPNTIQVRDAHPLIGGGICFRSIVPDWTVNQLLRLSAARCYVTQECWGETIIWMLQRSKEELDAEMVVALLGSSGTA